MSDTDFIIVGIGASAGGIEAAKQFFQAMPEDSGMAFVLVQHLDPTHESLMSELIGRFTKMPVCQAAEEMRVAPNSVYIIPPDNNLTITGDLLHIQRFEQRRGMRAPIDDFFRSLAETRGQKAVGVVLSGTASDGTLGLKEIKLHGGLTIAQDPDEAQHDGMPRSAINSGAVDYILQASKIPEILRKYSEHPYVTRERGRDEQLAVQAPLGLDGILAMLRVRVRHDFRGYKKSTLVRRIERRMSLHDIREMNEYRDFLRDNPEEVKELLNDLLIGVTSFFREPNAWEFLADDVLKPLVVDRNDDEREIRLWVPGCSNGKEAYSLAMLLVEQADVVNHRLRARIFATDIDLDALGTAREGVYPGDITEEITPERLKRFFIKQGSNYQVRKELRDMLTFAAQNIVIDPPFSNMDLISCRNLLIYLEAEVQQRLIDVFHFALVEGGHLFLGNSESVGRQEDLFKTVSRKWRIFKKVGPSRKPAALNLPLVQAPFKKDYREGPIERPPVERARHLPSQMADHALAGYFVPSAVLVDARCNILYYHGNTEDFLSFPPGEPTQDLLALVRKGLRGRLRAAVQEVQKKGKPIAFRGQALREDQAQPTLVSVLPTADEGMFVVAFIKEGEPQKVTEETLAPAEAVVQSLEQELKSSREELQNVVEELETSNEELKASNEEAMSMNEELQSTNEELETSKEELQSVNEELTTLNTQLQEKVEELEAANNDLDNLIISTEIATIFLDPDLRLKRFTPASTELLNLIPSDQGRPISDLASKVSSEGLVEDAEKVLHDLATVSREVSSDDDRWYVRRTLPYRTNRNTVEGVVITFAEVTDLKRSQEQERLRSAELEAIMESVPAAVWVAHDPECKRITGNKQSYAMLKLEEGSNASKSAPEGEAPLNFRVLKDGRELMPEELPIQQAASTGEPVYDFEEDVQFEDGTTLSLFGNAAPFLDADGKPRGAIAAFVDISALKEAEKKLQDLNDELEDKVAQRTKEISVQAKRLQLLTRELSNAEQRERRRLSKVLHDHLQQLLVGAKFQLSMAQRDVEKEDCATRIGTVSELIDESIEATRDLTLELSPPVLYDSGLNSALTWLAGRMEQKNGLKVEIVSSITDERIGESQRVLLFDCIRELLLNVLKHSGQNKAKVELTGDSEGFFKATVSDSGKGFDKEDEENSESHFGLFHIRQRLQSIGGLVKVESQPGEGASVELVCPYGPDANEREPAEDIDFCEGRVMKKYVRKRGDAIRVLLVDDHPLLRQGLGGLLELEEDLEIAGEASDGVEAIEKADELLPDVILMDINMPRMSGLEAIAAIVKRHPEIKIFGLSVHEESGMADAVLAAGAVGYMNKGVQTTEVCRRIRQAMGKADNS